MNKKITITFYRQCEVRFCLPNENKLAINIILSLEYELNTQPQQTSYNNAIENILRYHKFKYSLLYYLRRCK